MSVYCVGQDSRGLTCLGIVPPEHDPCCSSHGRPMCCIHYCRMHFVEVHKCSPERHAATRKAPAFGGGS